MKVIQAKLHSRRGISILFALLLLLAGSMVSVVILNAATTAAHRSHDDQLREQEALALSSAAGVIRDALKAADCTIDSRWEHSRELDVFGLGVLQNVMETPVKSAYAGITYNGVITITPPSVNGESLSEKVKLAYTLQSDNAAEAFRLEGTFTMDGSDRKLFLTAYPTNVTRYTVTNTEIEYREVKDTETGEPVLEPYETYWYEFFTRFQWDQVTISNQKEGSAG